MFSQEALMPKSHSNDKNDKISAHLPIDVSNDVKSYSHFPQIQRV